MIKKGKVAINYLTTNDFGLTISALVVLFAADYINIFGYIDWDFSKINTGMWNVIIIFVIFYLSYVYVDSRNSSREEARIERDKENHNRISYTKDLLLNQVYLLCLSTMKYIESDEFVKYIIPKIDFNKTSKADETFSYLLDNPFDNDDKIMELALKGYLSKEELSKYMYIKGQYKRYVFEAVATYDHKEFTVELKKELSELLMSLVKD